MDNKIKRVTVELKKDSPLAKWGKKKDSKIKEEIKKEEA